MENTVAAEDAVAGRLGRLVDVVLQAGGQLLLAAVVPQAVAHVEDRAPALRVMPDGAERLVWKGNRTFVKK